jgi:exonuclease SbcC
MHPFGCFSDNEVGFEAGLNVVLGLNEAGKTTLFRAIRHSLFVTTSITRPKHGKYVAPYLPVAGGDSLRVDLELVTPEGRWTLKRRWGAAAGSELELPTGGTLSEEAGVIARIATLLPATPGTFAGILLTGQSELAATLDSVRTEAKESLSELADILRRAVLSTGGVSVDRFIERLEAMENEAFSRWDRAGNGPEGSRGIENPWKKEVGTVLGGWYGLETARAGWKKALDFEAGLDEVNAKLRAVSAGLAEREAFVSGSAAAARDARERRTVEAELGRVRAEAATLRKVAIDWPVAAHEMRELEKASAAAEATRAPLEKELQSARRAEEGRGLREKHARVARRKAQADEEQAKLAQAPRLERKALEEIRRAGAALERERAGLEAGRLSATVAGRAAADVVVQEDFGPEGKRRLGPGETIRLKASGRIRIVHRDLEIEVRSGDADLDERAEKASAARRSLDETLARWGVRDVADAEERFRTCESLAADAAAAAKNLADELAGETLADMETRVAGLGPAEQVRPADAIASDIATLKARQDGRAGRLGEIRRQAQEWASAYGSPETLLDRLAEAKAKETELAVTLARFAPLPEGFALADAFLREFEKAQAELSDLRVQLEGIKERKRGLEANAPEASARELEEQVKSGEESFRIQLRRGEALGRVRALSRELLGESDSAIFKGMQAQLDAMVTAMTGGRHASVEMEGPLPTALADGEGRSVGWDLLSTGTKDTLALALRLAMASYFLGDADGFLMMDDPLVDMDPDRQQAAARALQSFSAGRQLILFTCHPSTAELLGGTLVRL